MILMICGVSGSGKTTIGGLLADRLGVNFYDADDFHSDLNIEKMSKGLALTDEDRNPWLQTLASKLSVWQTEGGAVLACSALKESYRETLAASCNNVRWIMLSAPEELLDERLSARKHFFNRDLLRSQLDILESPNYGFAVDASGPPDEVVDNILMHLVFDEKN